MAAPCPPQCGSSSLAKVTAPRSIWQDFTARCVWWGGGTASTAPLNSLTLFPLSFGWKCLCLKGAHEQTHWGIPLNEPSLFRIPGSLLRQSLGGGGTSHAPARLGAALGGGSPEECGAAAAPPPTAARTGAARGKAPAPRDLRAQTGSNLPTAPAGLVGSSAKWEDTSCCVTAQAAASRGPRRGKTAGGRPARGPRPQPPPGAPGRPGSGLRAPVPSRRNTLH